MGGHLNFIAEHPCCDPEDRRSKAGLLVVAGMVVKPGTCPDWQEEEDDNVNVVARETRGAFHWKDEEALDIVSSSYCYVCVRMEYEMADCIVAMVFLVVVVEH